MKIFEVNINNESEYLNLDLSKFDYIFKIFLSGSENYNINSWQLDYIKDMQKISENINQYNEKSINSAIVIFNPNYENTTFEWINHYMNEAELIYMNINSNDINKNINTLIELGFCIDKSKIKITCPKDNKLYNKIKDIIKKYKILFRESKENDWK